jgi:hypothetical protein
MFTIDFFIIVDKFPVLRQTSDSQGFTPAQSGENLVEKMWTTCEKTYLIDYV